MVLTCMNLLTSHKSQDLPGRRSASWRSRLEKPPECPTQQTSWNKVVILEFLPWKKVTGVHGKMTKNGGLKHDHWRNISKTQCPLVRLDWISQVGRPVKGKLLSPSQECTMSGKCAGRFPLDPLVLVDKNQEDWRYGRKGLPPRTAHLAKELLEPNDLL